jgi:hypothetical protein
MSNIKKARYTNAPKLLNQKLSVIKVTGTSKNIKQINFILPKEYGMNACIVLLICCSYQSTKVIILSKFSSGILST